MNEKRYMEITTWLLENHNEVYDEWNEVLLQIIEEERLTNIEKEKAELERKRPNIMELANWCKENEEWLLTLNDPDTNIIKAIQLSVRLMVEALDNLDINSSQSLSLIGTYQTAIKSIASGSWNLQVVGYLKNGRRVITPFNHCWYHTHGDDIKFDSNTEYDWGGEEE
tara:strand:- start:802 stop:1305 length:504 start_codon:yes stop_codon:yes gene_type:complete